MERAKTIQRIISLCEHHFGCNIKEQSKARHAVNCRATALVLFRELGLTHGQCANITGISRCNCGNRWRAALKNSEIMTDVETIRQQL